MANPVGKPPWIPTLEELKKIEALAARGMEQQDIALCLGIRAETLSKKKSEIALLNEAIKRGKARGIARVTAALLANVDNGNVTAQIFYLKCQAKWRDSEVIVISNNDDIVKAKEDAKAAKKNVEKANKKDE